MPSITFSIEELTFLEDVLSAQLEQMADTKEQMVIDNSTLDTLDKFLETMAEHDRLTVLVLLMREKVGYGLQKNR